MLFCFIFKANKSVALTHLHLLSVTLWLFQTPEGQSSSEAVSDLGPSAVDKKKRGHIYCICLGGSTYPKKLGEIADAHQAKVWDSG